MGSQNPTNTDLVTSSSNTTTDTTDGPVSFEGYEIGFTAKAVFVLVGSLEVSLGVLGNTLLLSVLLTLGMRSFHLLFVANLALADLLTTGYWMPFLVLDLILGRHPVMNEGHCLVNAFIIYICGATSVLSLTSISLNRYLHVCHSQLYALVFTRTRVIVWCLALWTISALFSFPPLLRLKAGSFEYDPTSHTCSSINKPENVYMSIVMTCFCTVPLALIVHWNFAIFRHWKRFKLNLDVKYVLSNQTSQKQASCEFGSTKLEENCVTATIDVSAATEKHDGTPANREDNEDTELGDQLELEAARQYDPENSEHKCNSLEPFGSRIHKERMREREFVRSLCAVVLLTFICFLPFAIIEVVNSIEKQPPEVVIGFVLLLSLNCSVNWIVYGLMNPSIRRADLSCLRRVGRGALPCPRLKTQASSETDESPAIYPSLDTT